MMAKKVVNLRVFHHFILISVVEKITVFTVLVVKELVIWSGKICKKAIKAHVMIAYPDIPP
jgi:hypothetical protein